MLRGRGLPARLAAGLLTVKDFYCLVAVALNTRNSPCPTIEGETGPGPQGRSEWGLPSVFMTTEPANGTLFRQSVWPVPRP